jgi:spoIIIJ-associated protein
MDDDDQLDKILGDKSGSQSADRGVGLDDDQESGDAQTESDKSSEEGAQQLMPQINARSKGEAASLAGGHTSAANDSMEEAIMYAKKYIEDLLSFFGLNTDVYATTEDGEVIELDVPSTHLNGFLIGHNGDTVRALQYTISNALKNQNFSHTRVNVDVAEYKKQRGERLAKTAEEWFKEVRDSGKSKELQPMNAADRRVVHQAATDYGLTTESVGFGRDRHIVLKPAAGAKDSPADEE